MACVWFLDGRHRDSWVFRHGFIVPKPHILNLIRSICLSVLNNAAVNSLSLLTLRKHKILGVRNEVIQKAEVSAKAATSGLRVWVYRVLEV